MDPEPLFPDELGDCYATLRELMLALGDDIVEEFTKTQVSYGADRKFAWLTPLTKTKALLNLDLWEEHTSTVLRDVIRYRDDKITHQIEVHLPADVEAVAALGWFEEAVAWGRRDR